ncbi:MAG: NAD-dependent epimerase/dehydratase family protein [Acidobacteria bacterium]|nr:NAD-dependent epimerase/dehydratase family protein [Acidobacteriota bacterium]MBI3280239.1 NAD-dependent epimerase/dehydratase family protein [Acidobacteriota bacterium]
MKPALVTGATGFLGWHVARALIGRGHKVRALVRGGKRVPELDVETVAGDLRNFDSLGRAVRDCGVVFHVAADYRLWAKNPAELYESNVEGTRNLLRAAAAAGVERVVYTSTVGCIGVPAGGQGDEQQPVGLEQMTGAYKRSKFLAEQVALAFARDGLPVVIVNPTAPVGDHDFRPTPTGRIVLDYLRGGMPAYVDTGLNLVDARDTAEGHLLAWERGRPGERYILGCENLTLEQIFERLERISGCKSPNLRIPFALAYAAGVVSTAWAHVSGREPRAPLDGVRMARKKMWVSSAKANRDLGFSPGPVDAALSRAVEWFRGHGYVQ